MKEIPGDLMFLKSHEWVRVEDNGTATIGISDHAQGLLGDLVYVELPNVGDTAQAGTAAAVVESVKAASDVYSPVSGEIVAVNDALADTHRECRTGRRIGPFFVFSSESRRRSKIFSLSLCSRLGRSGAPASVFHWGYVLPNVRFSFAVAMIFFASMMPVRPAIASCPD